LDRRGAKVIEIARSNATIRLDYTGCHWGEGSRDMISHASVLPTASFDRMAESSGAATRALLGWLESMRGPDADFNPELEAVKAQIRRVKEDECGGSDYLSDRTPSSDRHTALFRGIVGLQYVDTEPVDWNSDGEGSDVDGLFGWCGLDAVNSGLAELSMPTISQEEAVGILSTTSIEIARNGMSVNQLEALVNTRQRSIAIVDLRSKQAHRLRTAKYENSIIFIGLESITHFVSLRQC